MMSANAIERQRALETSQRYGPIAKAVGLLTPTLQPMELIVLVTSIANDAEVQRRAPKYRTFDEEFPSMYEDDYEALVRDMSKEDRAALRERVGRKHGLL